MPSEQSPEGGRGIPKAHGQCSWCVQGTPRKPVLLGQRKQKGDETRELTGPNVGGPSRPCCCSVTKLCPTFVTLWAAACQAYLSLIISQSLPKFMSIKSVMPSNHFILYHLLLLLPSIFPSTRVFSSELAVHIM